MNKISGLLCALALSSTLCGCVFDDLSHCPVETGGGLSLRLACRAGTAEAGSLPIERADFYVFDSLQHFVCSLTDKDGPFTAEHEYHLPLPAGTYTVVSWANLQERVSVTPEPFIPGQTTLDEARLRLAGISLPGHPDSRTTSGASLPDTETAVNTVDGLPAAAGPDQYLYYGAEPSVRVHTGQTTRAVLPLKRDTKEIILSVRYKRADGTPCDDPSHHTDAYIRTADGILGFENSLSPCTAFLLESMRRDDAITGGFDATFHKMALRLDEPEEPQILLTAPGRPGEVIYRESLLELLTGTQYPTQDKLDKEDTYRIILVFYCTHTGGGGDTHITVRIWVNGWEYVPMGGDL